MANSILQTYPITGPLACNGRNALPTDANLTNMSAINSTYTRAPAQGPGTRAIEKLLDAFQALCSTPDNTNSYLESSYTFSTASSETSDSSGTDSDSNNSIISPPPTDSLDHAYP